MVELLMTDHDPGDEHGPPPRDPRTRGFGALMAGNLAAAYRPEVPW
jgi:hypothetical protein